MKKATHTFLRCYLIFVWIGTSFSSQAQYLEVGFLGGAINYQGDIAPSSIWSSVAESHAVVGGLVRYNFNNTFAARLSFAHGTISGSDHEAKEEARRSRNLHFESPITELALLGEFNLFGYTPSNLFSDFSPYIFGGIAVYRFNPQAEYLERWVELQPLGTEGQGMPGFSKRYNLTQFSIPFGGGIKKNINEEWTIAAEIGLRKTFTDYLDDVSTYYVNFNDILTGNGTEAAALGDRRFENTDAPPPTIENFTQVRGNPDNNDWYLFANLTVTYNFVFKGIYTSSFNSRHLGCPRNF